MSSNPHKNSIAVRIHIEELAAMAGGEWARRIHTAELIEPTATEWDAYNAAVAHLEAAREYRGFDEGCNCDHAYIEEPHPETRVEYAETAQEWRDRIAAKVDAGEWPAVHADRTFVNFNALAVDAPARAIDNTENSR